MDQRTCTIEGCGKKHYGRGWCKAHYLRWRRYDDPLGQPILRPPVLSDTCSVEGCDRPRARKSNGTRRALCPGHTSRKRHTGQLRADEPIRAYARIEGGGHLSSYGYWLKAMPDHPLAFANGDVLEHRALLYDAIGPGEHVCHWCQTTVAWEIVFPAAGSLVVDHIDGNRLNNDLTNIVPACQPCNAARAKAGNPHDWTPLTD